MMDISETLEYDDQYIEYDPGLLAVEPEFMHNSQCTKISGECNQTFNSLFAKTYLNRYR